MTQTDKEEKKLTYKDIQLGEKRVAAFHRGETPSQLSNYPVYLNTRRVTPYHTTTDLISAALLAGMNIWLMGKKSTGKSVIMNDYAHFLFGGEIRNGGKETGSAYITKAGNDFELSDHFIEWVAGKNGVVEPQLKKTYQACLFGLDELNHAHVKKQNDFYSFLEGKFIQGPFNVPLGQEGYNVVIATGNDPRDSHSQGAEISAGPFLSRFGVVLDINSPIFSPTDEDVEFINDSRIFPVGNKYSHDNLPINLLPRIIAASREIKESARDLGDYAESAFSFIEKSLFHCPGRKTSGKLEEMARKTEMPSGNWPEPCFECERKGPESKEPLCKLLSSSDTRVLKNTRLYVAALDYIGRLRAESEGTEFRLRGDELAFLAFELCGAYQPDLTNPRILETEFNNRNHNYMRKATDRLRGIFKGFGDVYTLQLREAQEGRPVAQIVSSNGILYPFTSASPVNPISVQISQVPGDLGEKELLRQAKKIPVEEVSLPNYDNSGEIALAPLASGIERRLLNSRREKK